MPLNPAENLFSCHVFVRGNSSQNRIERSNAQRIVGRHRDAMVRGLLGLQDNVAANLMNPLVTPPAAEMPDERFTAQIARQLHATASTSSRTSRSRIEAGGAESK